MASKFLQPTSRGFRHPTDTQQMNGNIYNQRRLNPMGGLDKLHEKYGPFKNDIGLKKPGATITK